MHPVRVSDIRRFTRTASTNANGRPMPAHGQPDRQPAENSRNAAKLRTARRERPWPLGPCNGKPRAAAPTPPIKDLATDATGQGLTTDQGLCHRRWSMHPVRVSDIRRFTRAASTNVNGRPMPAHGQPDRQPAENSRNSAESATARRERPWPPGPCNGKPPAAAPTPPIKGLATDAADRGLCPRRRSRTLPPTPPVKHSPPIKDFATDDGRCTPTDCPIFANLPGLNRPTSTADQCGAQSAIPAATHP
jgi:hypothetical protein